MSMLFTKRKIEESPLVMGVSEKIAYDIDTARWGCTAPTSISVKLYAGDLETDVSSTCLSGSASVVGTVITTPYVMSIKRNLTYRLDVSWTDSGNIMSAYADIIGER